MTVAALFVDGGPAGVYPALLGAGMCWDVERDAHNYVGDVPVVAHPPCQLWTNMAAVNWKRYGRELPAWYPGGGDRGCFAKALAAVTAWGGVLEHPYGSHAFAAHGLATPSRGTRGWQHCYNSSAPGNAPKDYWVCEVWQSAYGHPARKRTLLVYVGAPPPLELRWERKAGTHQVGWFDRNKPTLGKREASATPPEFALELIRLAEWSRGQ